jgi:hypothetical protein
MPNEIPNELERWRDEVENIDAKFNRTIDGINIRSEYEEALINAVFKNNLPSKDRLIGVKAAVARMLARCKAESIDPLTIVAEPPRKENTDKESL